MSPSQFSLDLLFQVGDLPKMSFPPHLNRPQIGIPTMPPGIPPPQFAGFPPSMPPGESIWSLVQNRVKPSSNLEDFFLLGM